MGAPAATSWAKDGPLRVDAGVGGEGGDDLGEAEEGEFFEALRGDEQDLVAGEQGGDLGDGGAQVLGGGDEEEGVGLEDGAGEVGGDEDVGGEGEAGEVGEVFAEVGELVGEGGGVGPEEDLVAAAAGEGDGERGAPRAGAEDGDAAHAGTRGERPKRLSVPARRRRMLAWCLTMTSRGMPTKAARGHGRARARRSRGRRTGRAAAARMLASETKREIAKTARKTSRAQRVAAGERTRKTPRAVATPLPPRKPSQTGKTWPSTAAMAAVQARWKAWARAAVEEGAGGRGHVAGEGEGDQDSEGAFEAVEGEGWRGRGRGRRSGGRWWRRYCRCRGCGCPGGGRRGTRR